MQKLFYIITLIIILCTPFICKSNNIDEEVNQALKMMLNNDPKSFNILDKLCKETNNEEACLGVGYCYMNGIGTYFEVFKAEEIFKYYIKSKNIPISEEAKACLALLYENGIVSPENIEVAFSLWKELLNSKNSNIVNMAKKNLYILNLYGAARDIILGMMLFGCDRISFAELREGLNNKEFNKLPKNIFNAYVDWRTAFFKSYKSNGDIVKSALTNVANGLIKGFLKDPSLISDALKAQEKADSEQLLAQHTDQLWINLMGIFQNEGLSEMLLDYPRIEGIGICRR